ncbi:MAG: hypothetical protein ABI127_06045 [Dokdonella sp.]
MNPEEREWQAQQRAIECERKGHVHSEEDALTAGYLPVARALRQPIRMHLPADFAARVAGLAMQRRPVVEIESTMEQRLLLILGIILGITAVFVGLIYGASWFAPALGRLDQLGQSSLSLLFGVLGCLGISALAQQLSRLFDRRDSSLV